MPGKQMRKQREHLCKGSVALEPDMRQELHVSQFCHCIKYEAIHHIKKGGHTDHAQILKGLQIMGAGVCIDLITASPRHIYRFFLCASLISIFLKSSPLTIWHDEISYPHAIPWKQEKLSGNLLYCSWIPHFNSHFLALSTLIFEARGQLVCRASLPIKPMFLD